MKSETAAVADRETVAGPGARTGDPLSGFCEQAFGSLPRSDQRRWGELYVRGLVTVPGRKTIRKISELAGGTAADQSLQQFVNQSPWDWGPVRSELAHLVAGSAPVEAWIAAEVAFPKNGDSSVGVCTQYVGPAARTLNCQLAVALSFAGAAFCCPVNWRLMLPRSWDRDFRRRSRSHLPATERHRPCWQHVLDLLDEAVDDWGAAPRPVLADRRHDPDVEQLLRGLDERGLRYLVRIGDDLPIHLAGRPVRAADAHRTPAGERVSLVTPPAAGERRGRSHYVAMPLPGPGPARGSAGGPALGSAGGPALGSAGGPARGPAAAPVPGRWLVSRRLGGTTTGLWLTDLGHLAAVIRLTHLLDRSRRHHTDFERGSGLHHFEGRSFRGWHHHVTLASAAHAYRLLTSAPGLVPAPRAAFA